MEDGNVNNCFILCSAQCLYGFNDPRYFTSIGFRSPDVARAATGRNNSEHARLPWFRHLWKAVSDRVVFTRFGISTSRICKSAAYDRYGPIFLAFPRCQEHQWNRPITTDRCSVVDNLSKTAAHRLYDFCDVLMRSTRVSAMSSATFCSSVRAIVLSPFHRSFVTFTG